MSENRRGGEFEQSRPIDSLLADVEKKIEAMRKKLSDATADSTEHNVGEIEELKAKLSELEEERDSYNTLDDILEN